MITLPVLPYDYNALEPFIDETTMRIHHTKHHQTYIDKLNTVLEKYQKLKNRTIEELLRTIDVLPVEEKDRTVIRNSGGGHANHSLYWSVMGPKKETDTKLVTRIIKTFGTLEDFKKQFSDLALGHFGSGWAWLAENPDGKLVIYTTPNQDSPILRGDTPLVGLDVWEHAYYLKYQNRRADYIAGWWNTLKLL
jgi:superoxide dismutase, Fe-Mn family